MITELRADGLTDQQILDTLVGYGIPKHDALEMILLESGRPAVLVDEPSSLEKLLKRASTGRAQ